MATESSSDYKSAKSVYDFTVKDGHGNDVSLEKYRDKVLLVVNIASKCGLTKGNYAELTELSQKYADKGMNCGNLFYRLNLIQLFINTFRFQNIVLPVQSVWISNARERWRRNGLPSEGRQG